LGLHLIEGCCSEEDTLTQRECGPGLAAGLGFWGGYPPGAHRCTGAMCGFAETRFLVLIKQQGCTSGSHQPHCSLKGFAATSAVPRRGWAGRRASSPFALRPRWASWPTPTNTQECVIPVTQRHNHSTSANSLNNSTLHLPWQCNHSLGCAGAAVDAGPADMLQLTMYANLTLPPQHAIWVPAFDTFAAVTCTLWLQVT
jgi:hypothetical protein